MPSLVIAFATLPFTLLPRRDYGLVAAPLTLIYGVTWLRYIPVGLFTGCSPNVAPVDGRVVTAIAPAVFRWIVLQFPQFVKRLLCRIPAARAVTAPIACRYPRCALARVKPTPGRPVYPFVVTLPLTPVDGPLRYNPPPHFIRVALLPHGDVGHLLWMPTPPNVTDYPRCSLRYRRYAPHTVTV